ncbi:DUF3575 domain-containing protein [Polaribacter batillariae]|uniref:DUF3575 domain-containing protein n=1 Tax=Polaribacter batillariae TaxID=2808900 RepID=A0ABX7SRK1_9FLAO|nr:DUF3575 domain-containing protein [Polaribacter batillariae]QTD36857.1 DUF3575 domain-containing protein [Polaribacter batillariae]
MKKISLLLLFFAITFNVIAQDKEEEVYPQDVGKKTEIKLNALTLLAGKWIDLSYERLIDEESSYGISGALNTDTSKNSLHYSLTPFYRRYFSEKFARGFFIEGFGMLFSAEDRGAFSNNSHKTETGFAFGVSVGGKWVSKKGFTTELLLGVGRNMVNSNYNDTVGRAAISVGYRF